MFQSTASDSSAATSGYLAPASPATKSGAKTDHWAGRDPHACLMVAVRNGDEAAFAELVAFYYERVRSWLKYVLTDPELANDVTQDVFLRVFRARERYVPRAKFSTWLFHIVKNLVSNARRSQFRRREVDMQAFTSRHEWEPLDAMTVSRETPCHDLVEGHESRELLRGAIAKLNQRQKKALSLSVYRGMDQAQIARRMGIFDDGRQVPALPRP